MRAPMVERFFGKLTDKATRRGVFHSVLDLIAQFRIPDVRTPHCVPNVRSCGAGVLKGPASSCVRGASALTERLRSD